MSNWGAYGNLFGADCEQSYEHPAFEFPLNSGISYGAGTDLWIGAVVNGDTVVSTARGAGPVVYPVELLPLPYPDGVIAERTTRDHLPQGRFCEDLYHTEDAVSDHDLIAEYYDTITNVEFTGHDPVDGRAHVPIGLKVRQTSYSWSYEYAQDFVILEYEITAAQRLDVKSTARTSVRDVFIGLSGFGQALHADWPFNSNDRSEFHDGIAGTLRSWPLPGLPAVEQPMHVVWVADNDGAPAADGHPVTGVGALAILDMPATGLRTSFNWWVFDDEDAGRDWGPVQRHNLLHWIGLPLGTPRGDIGLYRMMSNGEFDYPQMEAAIDHSASGWLPPPTSAGLAADIADGAQTWWVYSFGPLDFTAGDTIRFAVAAVGGEHFHTDPSAFEKYFDPVDPSVFASQLDFSDLARNVQWAGWLYDSPGVDTDEDGYRGEFLIVGPDTVYYLGDGVPDFAGPPPPVSPRVRAEVEEGKVTLRWNGLRSETEIDPFSHRVDFEGYRVYMSRTGHDKDWSLLAQRDQIDWVRYLWNPRTQRWKLSEPPFTLDSLKVLFDSISVTDYGHPFHPDSFDVALVEDAFLEIVFDEHDPAVLDSNYYYFKPYDANEMVDDQLYVQRAAQGFDVGGLIRKLYPHSPIDSVAYHDDGSAFFPYYEYAFTIDGLQIAEPVFFTVTALDNGDPVVDLPALESAHSASMIEVWPINSAAVVQEEHPKPGVYPNPYRIIDDYNAGGWENPRGLEPNPERARKVTFYNVPDTCVVSIWSLDGDLIKRLEHKSDPALSEASVVVWNLITRNTQAIKTGIYLYSVESRYGTDVGKLVIIK